MPSELQLGSWIWKKGSVEQYSPVPYLATLMNCMAWVLYGVPWVTSDSTLVVTINGSGTIIELVYVGLFLFFCCDRRKRIRMLAVLAVELAFIAILSSLVLTEVHTHNQRSKMVGIICILFSIMMYAASLSVMVPNGIGSFFGLVQLILYATYYKSTKDQTNVRRVKGDLSLSEVVANEGDS
ncbi:hypothetical protein SAY86_027131 [Trapa natans]|uniref:Uncharacterized protein n=1 Tax=Trapa natans TaxID=22666 RepID=A0AAN7KT90_TRANT|nr:hypothetical protein SAY86_027131 [Trapa natans]